MLTASVLVGAGALAFAVPAHADVTEERFGGVLYQVDDADGAAGAAAVDFDPSLGSLTPTILSTITIDGAEYPVTSADDYAFCINSFATAITASTTLYAGWTAPTRPGECAG